MGGIIGRLFREFAMTLSTAIIVSLLISLTTTPMICAYMLRRTPREATRNWWTRASDWTFGGMQRAYTRALDWSLDAGPVIVAILICTIVLNVYLFTIVPKGFFPQQDTGQLNGIMQADQSSSFQISKQRLTRFVNIIRRDPAVQSIVGYVNGGRGGGGGGFTFIALKPSSHAKGGTEAVMDRLRPKLSRVSGASMFLTPVQDLRVGGRQSNATYQYTLEADNIDDLHTWASKLAEALKAQPALEDVNTDQEDHGLESFVNVDWDKASRLGLTARDVDNTLYDAFGQRQVSTIYNALNQYHVIMEVQQQYANDPSALNNIYISTAAAARAQAVALAVGTGSGAPTLGAVTSPTAVPPAGATTTANTSLTTMTAAAPASGGGGGSSSPSAAATVAAGPPPPPTRDAATSGVAVSTALEPMAPLSAIATWAPGSQPRSINHQDESLATTISFNLAQGKSLSDATTAVEQAEADIGMPVTIHGSFQGTAKVYQQSLSNEPVLIAVAILAVYIVLGVLYESYVHPLTVISTLPSAGVGAVTALILFHLEFSIIAMIGVVLLIGIVKKNAIMIIDFALEAERSQGLTTREAIRQASLLRFRPIMMTTFAAMLGALPLAIGWGEGSELRRPLGVTIIGGLLVSQVLTLITTPVVYLYLDRLRRRSPEERRLSGEGAADAPLQPA